MRIRRMRKSDFPQVLRLIRKTPELSIMEGYEYVGRTELENLVRKRGCVSVVAEEDGEVLGLAFGVLEPLNERSAWLYHLVVKKKARNRGIGTLLLREYEKALRRRGVEMLMLNLHAYKKLKKFYREKGFRVGNSPVLLAIKKI